MRQYRVVVIDDDPEVIDRVEGRISCWKREFEGEIWQVDVGLVLVKLERESSSHFGFCESTILDLGQKFSIKPDLILADYGFVEPGVLANWREQSKAGGSITPEQARGQFLTMVDLASAVKQAVAGRSLDSAIRNSLQRNLIGFDGPLIAYTLTTRAFIPLLGELEFRCSKLKAALPGAEIIPLDTSYQLYNREEFADEKHEPRFYAHLVGGLIDKSVQTGLLQSMLEDARNLKFLRWRRSVLSVGAIVALGGGVAAVSELLGGRMTALMQVGDYRGAAIVAALAVALVFLAGVILPFAFGSVMSGLFGRAREPPANQD